MGEGRCICLTCVITSQELPSELPIPFSWPFNNVAGCSNAPVRSRDGASRSISYIKCQVPEIRKQCLRCETLVKPAILKQGTGEKGHISSWLLVSSVQNCPRGHTHLPQRLVRGSALVALLACARLGSIMPSFQRLCTWDRSRIGWLLLMRPAPPPLTGRAGVRGLGLGIAGLGENSSGLGLWSL